MTSQAMGFKLNALNGFLEAHFAVQVGPQLAVAQAAHAGQGTAVAQLTQIFQLSQQPVGHHLVHAGVDAGVKRRARTGQPNLADAIGRGGFALQFRNGPSGRERNLQRPNDAARIARIVPLGGGGVQVPQPAGQLRTAQSGQGGAQTRPGGHLGDAPALDNGRHVLPRAANQNG